MFGFVGGAGAPTPPAFGTGIPASTKTYTIAKLVGAQHGGTNAVYKNQGGLLIQVIDTLIASGFYECLRSCDGATIAASNLWTDYTKLQGLGGTGGNSWITLRNVVTGAEYTAFVSVSVAWLEVLWYCSPLDGFTGGTTVAPPTATDSYEFTFGGDWLGTTASEPTHPNPKFRAWIWQSTDGEVTRVAWIFDPETTGLAITIQAFWMWEKVNAPPAGAWNPVMCWAFDNGNSYAAPAQFMTASLFNTSPKRMRLNAGVEEAVYVSFPQWGGTYFFDLWPTNESSGQRYWSDPPPLLTGALAAPRNGVQGSIFDVWFLGSPAGVPPFPAFDTAGSRRAIIIDAMMLPWDGSAVPGQPGSTDHPSTDFYGRAVL